MNPGDSRRLPWLPQPQNRDPARLHCVWHTPPPRAVTLADLAPSRLPAAPSLLSVLLLSGLRLPAARAWLGTATQGAHPSSHRPSKSAVQDTLPPRQHPVRRRPAGQAGRAAGDGAHGLTCSAPASRRPAAAGGGLALRARQRGVPGLAPRRGGGAEGGPAGVGLAEGGNGGDAITKPVALGAGRTVPPPAPRGDAEGRGRRPGKPPRAAAPAGRTVGCGPLQEGRAPGWVPPWTRSCPLRAALCGAKRNGAPQPPQPSPGPRFSEASPNLVRSTPDGTGLRLFTHCEGGRARSGDWRENFPDSKILKWGNKGALLPPVVV